MCSPRLAVASAMLLLGGARLAMCQDARAYQRRLDSLMAVWRHAHDASVAHALQQKVVYTQSDTARAGPITVLASKDRVPLARRAADSVYALLAPSYGSALELLRERTFMVRDVTPADADGVDSGYVVVLEITPTGDETYRQVLVTDPGLVTVALRNAVLRALLRGIDHQVAVWVANDLPSDTAASTAWPAARLSLLSSGAAVARRCYGGDLAQCRLALRLKETSDPVVDLYDDTDRRRLVGHVEDDWRGRSLQNGAGVCVAGNDETCIALLRNLEIPDPVSSAHRVQLIQVAMSMGGADAMQRLLLTSGTLDERLAAAAKVPADSVVRVWLNHVRSGSKSSEDMSPLIAGFSLGWTVLFGAMALRSSRWR